MAVNHVQALDSYPMDGWRSSRTHPLARRETLTGPQVRILHHPLHWSVAVDLAYGIKNLLALLQPIAYDPSRTGVHRPL